MFTRNGDVADLVMPGLPVIAAASKLAIWLGRASNGLVIPFALFKLVPWSIVTETMDRIGYGSCENLARCLGTISLVCKLLSVFPPASFAGATLMTGYLGGAMASLLRAGSPLFGHIPFGLYLGVMVWVGLWLRGRGQWSPFAGSFDR